MGPTLCSTRLRPWDSHPRKGHVWVSLVSLQMVPISQLGFHLLTHWGALMLTRRQFIGRKVFILTGQRRVTVRLCKLYLRITTGRRLMIHTVRGLRLKISTRIPIHCVHVPVLELNPTRAGVHRCYVYTPEKFLQRSRGCQLVWWMDSSLRQFG